jgi:hypothetical protein
MENCVARVSPQEWEGHTCVYASRSEFGREIAIARPDPSPEAERGRVAHISP